MDLYHYFNSSNNSDELWEKLHKVLRPFGVTGVFYGVGHFSDLLQTSENLNKFLEAEAGQNSFHFKTSYPSELMNVFDGEYSFEKDLSALHCLTETTPFIWDIDSQLQDEKMRQERMAAEYWYDLKMVGVTLPLRFGCFGKGGLGLSMSGLSGFEFDEIWRENQAEIIQIACLFDSVVRDGFLALLGIELTNREKDVIAWMAGGHSAKVIADKLGTKQNTVQNQIITLRQKFQARNNVQLIAHALSFQLL